MPTLLLFTLRLQLIAGHLLGVADVEPAAGDRGMVPRLAFNRLEAGKLLVLFRVRGHEHHFPLLADHDQQGRVAEQQNLAAAVVTLFQRRRPVSMSTPLAQLIFSYGLAASSLPLVRSST